MARPRLPLNTSGEIRTSKVSDDKWVAFAYHRDSDGRRRQYERSGPTRTAAVSRLKKFLAEKNRAAGGAINPHTRMSKLAQEYFTRLAAEVERGEIAHGTLRLYRGHWKNYGEPRLGALSVTEADVQVLDRFLLDLREHSPDIAKTMRGVLSGMMGIAARYKAIPTNPVRDVTRLRGAPSKPVRALEPAEAVDLLRKLTTLSKMPAEHVWVRNRTYTPTRVPTYVPDLVLFMLGTSLRIGQALAVHWPWVDFDEATVEIGPNIIRVKGEGLRLNEGTTKTRRSVLNLPESVMVMLLIRHESAFNPLGPVFPGAQGRLRDPHNTLGDLRRALDMAGYEWVTSHTFRRTVATVLDDAGLSARQIADQLTHTRPSMTQDKYMARNGRNGRAVAALNAMFATAPERRVVSLESHER